MGRERAGFHPGVECKQEGLAFVDAGTVPRPRRHSLRTAGVKAEGLGLERLPRYILEPGTQRERATRRARQVTLEVVGPGALVQPFAAARNRAFHGEGQRRTWIAQRDHGRVEARGGLAHALDCALRAERLDTRRLRGQRHTHAQHTHPDPHDCLPCMQAL